MKQKLWLCDLDGTLALADGRAPYEWHRVGEDKPNAPVIAVIRALLASDHGVGFISGRMEQCRQETTDWLFRHVTIDAPWMHLWMRQDGDYRPDEVVKPEIYREQVEPHYEVQGVFDDRAKVVAAWRSLGLTCFAVAEGNF